MESRKKFVQKVKNEARKFITRFNYVEYDVLAEMPGACNFKIRFKGPRVTRVCRILRSNWKITDQSFEQDYHHLDMGFHLLRAAEYFEKIVGKSWWTKRLEKLEDFAGKPKKIHSIIFNELYS